jgi:fatty acid synthase subunit beta
MPLSSTPLVHLSRIFWDTAVASSAWGLFFYLQVSPMLSVTGLTLKELQPHISKTNQHLPANSQLHVSLCNGPKTSIVTGLLKLYLVSLRALEWLRAQSKPDQSKTPFSQRKPVLTSWNPYHSEYLSGGFENSCIQHEEWYFCFFY